MTQEEFDKAPLLDKILYDTTGMLVEKHPSIAEAMEKYHQAKLKLLGIADVRRNADMITEQFEYRGFTFQRMTKDAKWYVCYANQIVNWGQYQNDLKEWVDGHYA